MAKKNFSPLSFIAVFGSGIRDPGSGMGKSQDPGSGINIPDPQHWFQIGILFRIRQFKQCFGSAGAALNVDPDPAFQDAEQGKYSSRQNRGIGQFRIRGICSRSDLLTLYRQRVSFNTPDIKKIVTQKVIEISERIFSESSAMYG
jgi:hypothetical protein